MSKFYKQYLERQQLEDDLTPVTVKQALKLIEERDYFEDLIALFKTNEQLDEQITIPGLSLLMNAIINKDRQFEKFDYHVNLVDVTLNNFTDFNSVVLNIIAKTDSENEFLIRAETAYNARSDYFDGVYKLDQFAKFCYQEKHVKLLQDNIQILNEYYQNAEPHRRNFRLLKDKEGSWYVRAITSTTHYNDYGIRFSLFVAALTFKSLIETNGWKFVINRAEYDESHIKVYFEKVETTFIKGIGHIKFIIEMSNDEIKREAMRFRAVYSIVTDDYEIYAKPQKLKTEIISIQHNFNPETVFKHLSNMGEFIKNSEAEIMNDIQDLQNVKDANQLRFLLYRKVEKAKSEDIKLKRTTILNYLNTRVDSISDLLILMNKVNLLVSDLEAKEYLRYIFYDVLIKRK